MTTILLVIGVFLVLLVIIVIIALERKGSNLSEFCTDSSDCPVGDACISNPQLGGKKQCFPINQLFCGIVPVTTLSMCSLEDPNSCSQCLNTPVFSCVAVNDENPYTWSKNGTKVSIPNSPSGQGWCLPDIVNRNVTCNPFTSEYVLYEVGENEYEWGCACKYPNLFDHSEGPDSDCTFIRACNAEYNNIGSFNVPRPDQKACNQNTDCSPVGSTASTDVCLQPMSPYPCGYGSTGAPQQPIDCSTEEGCVCHTPWSGDTVNLVDPMSGRCSCNASADLTFQCVASSPDYVQMNCVQGYCAGYETAVGSESCNQLQCYKSNQNECICCDCPTGYIRCPDDVILSNSSLIAFCEANGPTCFKDPCSTSDVPNGYFDKTTGSCVCPGDTCRAVEDTNSAVGEICRDLCGAQNVCGNRGTCYVPANSNSALCSNCVFPFNNRTDNTCTCSGYDQRGLGGAPCSGNSECLCNNCNIDPYGNDGNCDFSTNFPPNTFPTDNSVCVPTSVDQPVQCSSTVFCPFDTTCCPIPSTTSTTLYGCCSLPNATCCSDGVHCCPSDHPVCNVSVQQCTKSDGSDPQPWQNAPTP